MYDLSQEIIDHLYLLKEWNILDISINEWQSRCDAKQNRTLVSIILLHSNKMISLFLSAHISTPDLKKQPTQFVQMDCGCKQK